MSNLALVYRDRHKLEKARSLYLAALQMHRSKLGANHPQVGNDLLNLGEVSYAMHKPDDANMFFRCALATEKERGRLATSITGFSEANLAIIALRCKDTEGAEQLFRAAIENLSVTTWAEDPRLVNILETYAAALKADHRFTEAENAELKAMTVRVRTAIRNGSVKGFRE